MKKYFALALMLGAVPSRAQMAEGMLQSPKVLFEGAGPHQQNPAPAMVETGT